jgi:hypothetical protein
MKNKTHEAAQRQRLRSRLAKCTVPERKIFVRMYGPQDASDSNFMLNTEQIAKHNIDVVVDNMDASKLAWALKQVARTLEDHNEE